MQQELRLWHTLVLGISHLRLLVERAMRGSKGNSLASVDVPQLSLPGVKRRDISQLMDDRRGSLTQLQDDLESRLQKLRAELSLLVDSRCLDQLMLPVVALCDMWVLRVLSPTEQAGWAMLHVREIGEPADRDILFATADQCIHATDTPRCVLQLLLYCFKDLAAFPLTTYVQPLSDSARLTLYQQRLTRRLTEDTPPLHGTRPAGRRGLARPRHRETAMHTTQAAGSDSAQSASLRPVTYLRWTLIAVGVVGPALVWMSIL